MAFPWRLTAPVIASARPERDDPVTMVMVLAATMLPANTVPVPRVADAPSRESAA